MKIVIVKRNKKCLITRNDGLMKNYWWMGVMDRILFVFVVIVVKDVLEIGDLRHFWSDNTT